MFKETKCFNRFNIIQEEIKFLTNSDIRLKIFGCLYNEPSSMKGIHEKTKLNYSSISNNISKLEERGYIINKQGKYYLTNIARMKLTHIVYLNKSMNLLEDNSVFLNKHNVNNFQFNVFKDVSSLERLELIESTSTDVYRATRIFKDFFIGSHSLKAIFPYLHPQHSIIFEDWLERDVGVKLIIPKEVSKALINIIDNYKPKNKLKNRYLKVKSLNRSIDMALVVSDKGIALGFFKKDGTFDQNCILVSIDQKAIDWGKYVFGKYENLSGEYISLKNIIYKE